MPSELRISAKTLGALALPDFCPRCFWIQMHAPDNLPFQIFPGIFSSLDSYGKRLVHGWFDRHALPPDWLAPLGAIKGYVNPPHHSKFFVRDPATDVLLTGSPDGVLVKTDGSHLIIDYKTARFTRHQDTLFPMYDVQLNAYAYIGERNGLSPVSGLALVYTEPVTDDAAAGKDANMIRGGFFLEFSVNILPVEIHQDVVPKLMKKARQIFDLGHPPKGQPDCKDCAALRGLLEIAG